jgi:stearoyl-CoA desaturase (delta-9 desaturase)
MSKKMEKVTYVLTWLFQGSNYLSAYGYGIMHRMHHAFADTEKDPHSPKYDENLFAMMWRTKSHYQDINKELITVDKTFTQNVPQWRAFDKVASSMTSRIVFTLLYVLFFAYFASDWWQWLLLPVVVLMAPIHGVIINWYAHIYGYVNFKVSDTSKNLFPFDFLMMGEGYHNNHHKDSTRANFGGIRWHEIDPTYIVIKGLNKVGLIKLV